MHIPYVLLLASFLVGIMIGLTSMGGAALMTPFLILILGVRPSMAVGTDLVYAAVAKWVGGWVHWRQGTVDVKLALRLALGSVPGGILGVLNKRMQGRGLATCVALRIERDGSAALAGRTSGAGAATTGKGVIAAAATVARAVNNWRRSIMAT